MTRRFVLQRDRDITGVSGVGVVAEGVEFTDGVVALRWCTGWPTSTVFHEKGIEAVEAIHGHGGATRIVWVDGPAVGGEDVRERCVKWLDAYQRGFGGGEYGHAARMVLGLLDGLVWCDVHRCPGHPTGTTGQPCIKPQRKVGQSRG